MGALTDPIAVSQHELLFKLMGGTDMARWNKLEAWANAGVDLMQLIERELVFWQHPVPQLIPNATWWPVAWNTRHTTVGDWSVNWLPGVSAGTALRNTTIGVASNGAVLPQTTINVGDTTDWPTAGYMAIRFVDGFDRVIEYTGKTATSFTGCVSATGMGTLLTGQAVAQANVEFVPPHGGLCAVTSEIAWPSNATGVRLNRMRALNALGPGFHLIGGAGFSPAVATPADALLRTSFSEQPASSTANRVEVYQNSTGPLQYALVETGAPRLVVTLANLIEAFGL